jgi:hypothetical protein
MLLTSMVLVTFFTAMGMAMFGLASTALRTTSRRRDSSQAMSLAMGGLDHAVSKLKSDSDFAGYQNRVLGPGSITVTVSTPAGQPNRRVVTSMATVTGSGYALTRGARATLETGNIPPVFFDALGAQGDFEINGNITVASTPIAGKGDVHSNEDVNLSGASLSVDGQVTAAGTVSVNSGATVTGGATSGAPRATFPEIDTEFKQKALEYGASSGSRTVSDGSLVQGKINGNLTIGSGGARLNGVIWVTGALIVSGPVNGKGTVVVEGDIALEASGNYSASHVSNIAWITTSTSSTAVDLGGNRQFKGIIYAPYGGVIVHGGPSLLGGILAKSVTFSGNPKITKWTDFVLDPPVLPREFAIKGWEEL